MMQSHRVTLQSQEKLKEEASHELTDDGTGVHIVSEKVQSHKTKLRIYKHICNVLLTRKSEGEIIFSLPKKCKRTR